MTWPNFTWTNAGNYPGSPTPAQPWLGQPLAVIPGVSYFIPKTKIPAEVANYAFGALAAQDAALKANVGLFFPVVVRTFSVAAGVGWGNTGSYVTTIGSSPGPVLQSGGLFNGVQPGDFLELQASLTMAFVPTISNAQIRWEYQENATGSGSTSTNPASEQSSQLITSTPGSLTPQINVLVQAGIILSGGQIPGGLVGLYLNGKCGVPTANADWQILQGNIILKQWRLVSF
jgi:hypothetical protein